MIRYLFASLILIHGIIHLMGFLHGTNLKTIDQFKTIINSVTGIVWLIATVGFIVTAVLYFSGNTSWYWYALSNILISQVLIISAWQDAKFGSIANVLILIPALISLMNQQFEQVYRKDVTIHLQQSLPDNIETISPTDLEVLPQPVQQYLRYVGVIGKPKVYNFRATFTGEMRNKEQDWFTFESEQHNFFHSPVRLFFMKARVKGLPTYGYHLYQHKKARMLIKMFSLIPIVDIQSDDLFKAETVTYLNDLCIMAPAALINKNIQWEAIDSLSAKAFFSNHGVQIAATLYFNEQGQLINFVSDDRLNIDAQQFQRFSTPIGAYKMMNAYHLPSYGDAIWHYPDEEFTYGHFWIKSIEYNVQE